MNAEKDQRGADEMERRDLFSQPDDCEYRREHGREVGEIHGQGRAGEGDAAIPAVIRDQRGQQRNVGQRGDGAAVEAQRDRMPLRFDQCEALTLSSGAATT